MQHILCMAFQGKFIEGKFIANASRRFNSLHFLYILLNVFIYTSRLDLETRPFYHHTAL